MRLAGGCGMPMAQRTGGMLWGWGAEGGRVLWEDELTTAARKPRFGPRPMH